MRQRRLKVHEKTTYTQRLNARSGALRRAVYSPTFTDDVQQKKKEAAVTRADPSFVISTTKGDVLQNGHTGRQTDIQTHRHTHTHTQTDKHKDRQMDKQTDRQTDKHTDKQTDT